MDKKVWPITEGYTLLNYPSFFERLQGSSLHWIHCLHSEMLRVGAYKELMKYHGPSWWGIQNNQGLTLKAKKQLQDWLIFLTQNIWYLIKKLKTLNDKEILR